MKSVSLNSTNSHFKGLYQVVNNVREKWFRAINWLIFIACFYNCIPSAQIFIMILKDTEARKKIIINIEEWKINGQPFMPSTKS